VRDGSWLDYRWYQAELWTYYPPLHFLLLRASVTVFGDTELAYRLPAAVAGLCAVLLVGATAARLGGERRGAAAGLMAGLFLLAGATFYASSRSVRMDAAFLAAAAAVYYAYVRSWSDRRWLIAALALAGVAYLAKTLMVAFVLVPIAVDVLWHDRAALRDRALWIGLACFAALALAWHLRLAAGGAAFFPPYGGRVVTGIAGNYGLSTVAAQLAAAEVWMIPVWLAGLVWLAIRARADRAARLLLVGFAAGVAILVATATVLIQYTLPLFVPLAIGAGWAVGGLLGRRPVWTPVAVCAALGLFVGGNRLELVHPDYSPGVEAVAERARELGPEQEVLFFRDYNAAFDFYLDGNSLLVTDSAAAHQLFLAGGAMKRGPGVELVSSEELVRRLSAPGMVVVTTIFWREALEGYLARLPAPARGSLVMSEAGAYVLFHLPR
jgi:4-amino-4-deoxy-L-arabinose transferase-like glycosyltransferase